MVLAGTLALMNYAAGSIDRVQAAREQSLVAHSIKRTLGELQPGP